MLQICLYHIYQINKLEYAQDLLFNLNIANMCLVLFNISFKKHVSNGDSALVAKLYLD